MIFLASLSRQTRTRRARTNGLFNMACLGLLSNSVGLLKVCNETEENYTLPGSVMGSPFRVTHDGGFDGALLDCDRVAIEATSFNSGGSEEERVV